VPHSKFDHLFMPALAVLIGLYIAPSVTINIGARGIGGPTLGCLGISTAPFGWSSSRLSILHGVVARPLPFSYSTPYASW
jgi:hypothetical protein